MWVGVTLAVLVELVAPDVKTTAVAAYFFVISNVGGNMPLLVPPIKKAFVDAGYVEMDALRNTLYLLYPGQYVLGAVLFAITLVVLKRDIDYIKQLAVHRENIASLSQTSDHEAPGTYGSASIIVDQ